MKNTECRDAQDQLVEYIEGELDKTQQALLARHLETCAQRSRTNRRRSPAPRSGKASRTGCGGRISRNKPRNASAAPDYRACSNVCDSPWQRRC